MPAQLAAQMVGQDLYVLGIKGEFMKYAHYDPNTCAVLGWMDTEHMNYVLPPAETLLEVTEEQWGMQAVPCWASNGMLTTTAPPNTYSVLSSGGWVGDPVRKVKYDQDQEARRLFAATAAVQKMLDDEAKKKNYDDIKSAALRAGYLGPFHDEGVAYAAWMDACWAKCYEILAEVKAGRAEPTIPELLAEMPPLVLP